jgi:hypothetical protein
MILRISNLLLLLVWLALVGESHATQTNSLVWDATADLVTANVRGEALFPLLEDIAHQTGWHIFVEPGANRKADVKFSNLPRGEALKKLLGDLNFAFVPQTNEADHLYVFTTTIRAATQRVNIVSTNPAARAKHTPNELLIKLKPGTDADAFAKALGAKVTGRNDQLGLYKLQFDDAAATDAALAKLKTNTDVAQVDYNYLFEPPVAPQKLATAPVGPVSLTLNPPPDTGRVIVGLVDTAIQPLGAELDKFLLKQISINGDYVASGGYPTHATSMAETILRAIAQQNSGTSVQILPADIYGNSETATTWNLILGLQAVANGGANIINLSLGGQNGSPILDDFLNQMLARGIVIFAATGNSGANTVNSPASDPGVIAVAAKQGSQLAPYSNYGSGTALALPGQSVIYLNGQAYIVQGTSPATAYATGIAAGTKSGSSQTWAQILATMQKQFPVPPK